MSELKSPTPNTSGELYLLWSLPVIVLIWFGCYLGFPGFLNPMSPSLPPDQVAAFYFNDHNLPRIRYSMIVFNWFAVGLVPFLALIAMQMKRMAHHTPIFRYCFFGCIAGGPTLFTVADVFWLIAAFRPERDPTIVQMLNDIAWVTFTSQVGYLVSQNAFLAVAIYLDRQPDPVFPRWVGHFNLLTAAAMIPAAFAPMAMDGPLAWNGLLSFWVKNLSITAWIVVMLAVVGQSIYRRRSTQMLAA